MEGVLFSLCSDLDIQEGGVLLFHMGGYSVCIMGDAGDLFCLCGSLSLGVLF